MFVVLEGIDGAGCGEQRKALEKLKRLNGQPIFTLKYPHYRDSLGRAIHDFLHQKFDLAVESQFLLYASQMVAEKDKIADWRKKGVLISDRYFTSTLCFQGVKGFPLEKGLSFAKIFEIEVPDLVVFLDVKLKTALERKEKEKQELDRHEREKELMQKTDSMYQKFIERQMFAPWVKVDGEKPVEEVTKEIVGFILARR